MTSPINAQVEKFLAYLDNTHTTSILELGTKRSEPNRATHHKEWLPDASWTMADCEAGVDVDIVTDAHRLDEFRIESFDGVVAVSLFEHLERPWIAAEAIARVLKRGGVAYIGTHQTFPLHGYPNDYFRFSAEALSLIFEDAGLSTLGVGYAFRSQIIPPPEVTIWNPGAESWLNVDLAARKHG